MIWRVNGRRMTDKEVGKLFTGNWFRRMIARFRGKIVETEVPR